MTTCYTQHFFHAYAEDAACNALLKAAKTRLQNFTDTESRSIFAPLLGAHEEITQPLEALATALRAKAKHLIIIGSGGSGLNGKVFAALDTTKNTHSIHVIDSCDLFAVNRLMAELNPNDTALLFVSKSGTTVETLAYADIFLNWIESVQNASDRVAVITMHDGNVLHKRAMASGWACLAHDAHLCGRFSILSPAGLLPAAFLGLDIRLLLKGATASWAAPDRARDATLFQYLAINHGKHVHVCFAYGERFAPLSAWWRQSFAESLGKNGKGIFPARAQGTRDQHSQLQLYLDGAPHAIFTLITEASSGKGEAIGSNVLLPILANHTIGDIIQSQQMATLETLKNAGKSIRHLSLTTHDMFVIGHLICQWIQEIIMLGYMLEVNPFDQPAVEESKRLAREYLGS